MSHRRCGAGTGKTTTMLLRIEHLLESGVDPADILVLTFANEAASSIREAIADRLDPATAAAIDVYTYHSLCYHLVRDHAYYLGHSPHLEVVTDAQRRRIVERLLATGEYDFASEAASGAEIVDEVEQFIARLSRDNIEAETLLDRLPDQETIGVLSELTLLLERRANELFSFDNEAFRFFNRGSHLADVEAALITYGQFVTYCREELTAAPVDPTDPVVADVDRYLGLIQECITATRERIDLESAMTKHLPRVLFGNQIGGAATETVEQTPIGRITHYVAYLRVARHYAGIYADYRETIRAEGAVDFDELVREATSLLSDETVADSIRDEWAWVCCDEFQDTDATQFELLTALAQGGAGPNLLAIGDTDQAIYGWRGTDPAGLRMLGEQFDDHESLSLEYNFRSAQPILDVANETSYGPQASKRLREAPTDAERSGRGLVCCPSIPSVSRIPPRSWWPDRSSRCWGNSRRRATTRRR
ncbi:MAG: ATP-dependent helicase [Natrialbaceae archaeon]|nr:ATP-dependent helicase [Natrialbaceae archaeon]